MAVLLKTKPLKFVHRSSCLRIWDPSKNDQCDVGQSLASGLLIDRVSTLGILRSFSSGVSFRDGPLPTMIRIFPLPIFLIELTLAIDWGDTPLETYRTLVARLIPRRFLWTTAPDGGICCCGGCACCLALCDRMRTCFSCFGSATLGLPTLLTTTLTVGGTRTMALLRTSCGFSRDVTTCFTTACLQ